MQEVKNNILENLCYTALVYERINKKLTVNMKKQETETFIKKIIQETDSSKFVQIGKNFYISNEKQGIRITVNSNTYRIITVDKLVA